MATSTKKRTKKPPTRRRVSRRLTRYNEKRDLGASGEPGGGTLQADAGAIRRFVIQKHDATRLHYDFRLEMDGVYRSWAVPKGLPTTPGDRSLAVEVEDHPLEYGTFEGVIPTGNYGAGTVMLWDRGHYTVSGVSPETAYKQGKMHLALAGEKCVGEWTLVRMHARPGDRATNWLVIKNSAPAHKAPVTGADRALSVLSGRSLDQIASGERGAAEKRARRSAPPGSAKRTGHSAPPRTDRAGRVPVGGMPSSRGRRTGKKRGEGTPPTTVRGKRGRGTPPTTNRNQRSGSAAPTKTRRAAGASAPPTTKRGAPGGGTRPTAEHLAPAEFIAPMKAVSVANVPDGKWRLEIKLDGYRAIALINGGNVELWSRNHKSLTDDYPEVVDALKKIPCVNAVIDGEIVALDEQGRSRFQLLQNRGDARPPIVYYVFDLLHHDGRSLLRTPIEERQIALEVLVGKGSTVLRFSPVFTVPPKSLLAEVRAKQLEGIIAKTPGSFYEPDRRSGTWLKCKVHGEQEFVIGGFTPPKNSRKHFGAILVGYYDGTKLMYAGKVGSGFDTERLTSMYREFMQRRTDKCPFANLPSSRGSRFGIGMTASAMRQVTWLTPELVAQVKFAEWTSDGLLRQPVFLGVRDDKKAKEVVREGFRSASAPLKRRTRGTKT